MVICCLLLLLPRQPLLLTSCSIQLLILRRRRSLQFARSRYMRPLIQTHLLVCRCRSRNSSRSLHNLRPPTLLPLLCRPRTPRAQVRRSPLARSLHISLGLLRLCLLLLLLLLLGRTTLALRSSPSLFATLALSFTHNFNISPDFVESRGDLRAAGGDAFVDDLSRLVEALVQV